MKLIMQSSNGVARQLECPHSLMVCNDRFLIGLPTCFATASSSETNIMGLRLVKKISLHARIDE
jgi:hypothetical protein